MTKQHRKYSRKITRLCVEFNIGIHTKAEFNSRLSRLINTGKQINYI